jgi:hypothetical protein
MVRHVARLDQIKHAIISLVGNPEGKKLVGRPRRRWEDNISTNLKDTARQSVTWIQVAQNTAHSRTLANTVINLRVP